MAPWQVLFAAIQACTAIVFEEPDFREQTAIAHAPPGLHLHLHCKVWSTVSTWVIGDKHTLNGVDSVPAFTANAVSTSIPIARPPANSTRAHSLTVQLAGSMEGWRSGHTCSHDARATVLVFFLHSGSGSPLGRPSPPRSSWAKTATPTPFSQGRVLAGHGPPGECASAWASSTPRPVLPSPLAALRCATRQLRVGPSWGLSQHPNKAVTSLVPVELTTRQVGARRPVPPPSPHQPAYGLPTQFCLPPPSPAPQDSLVWGLQACKMAQGSQRMPVRCRVVVHVLYAALATLVWPRRIGPAPANL